MSARLFKGADAQVPAFTPFMMPGLEVGGDVPMHGEKFGAHRPKAASTEEATASASAIIADARAAASRIVDEANARAGEIERSARDRGLAESRTAVEREVALALEPIRDRLAATLDEVASLHEAVAARAERDLLRLSLEIARKIVHRETTMDPEIAMTLVRVALDRLHSRAVARVHLNPEDFVYVVSRAERLSAGGSVELVEDPTVGRGGCLVRTDMGDVDARIERQFAEIERGLFGA